MMLQYSLPLLKEITHKKYVFTDGKCSKQIQFPKGNRREPQSKLMTIMSHKSLFAHLTDL